ncbi:hypothetical protein K493DRAFT_319535 [Basidiobolus meristosporus CBS 931.73]|uniref:Uncharacterized protein n=1 Tax=Basidiobolus meristosporus CBS 931.73 TaxID=1314790 RepID=A0A1Y1XRG2_9FUNG|nr:hypothetical protein K493DRAFT_319535 [Basidiobolus meristosporus CBS 931.73]|eukprot:ORX88327.1 hypothetical protein K493DRAFT_319535 [Basidiobolus meristosporus CBS 931.73]
MKEASRYLPYCNQTLRMYGMSFDRNNQGELTFHRHISRRIQDGYAAYRDLIKRKKASQRSQHRA